MPEFPKVSGYRDQWLFPLLSPKVAASAAKCDGTMNFTGTSRSRDFRERTSTVGDPGREWGAGSSWAHSIAAEALGELW